MNVILQLLLEGLYKLYEFSIYLKYQCKMLPYRPRLMWHSLWVREDESHNSLQLNVDAYGAMHDKDKEKYTNNLTKRRQIVHDRTI